MQRGDLAVAAAVDRLRILPYEDLGFARVDHHRKLRRGFPEVVFGAGKTPDQIATIVERLAARNDRVLATRVDEAAAFAVRALVPDATYHTVSRTVVVDRQPENHGIGDVIVVCAGTSDLPVAEEAVITARLMGAKTELIADVGVAGLHRLLAVVPRLQETRVLVVVAGMEGALPSVVGGLVACPVIAVPTSIGYGANFGGLSALLTMLNSCTSGVSVVNIDNGFGAGYQAALINAIGAP